MEQRKKVLLVLPMPHEEGEQILASEVEVVRAPDYSPKTLGELITDVHGVIARGPAFVPGDIIRRGKKLEVLSGMGSGVDCIDVKAATEIGLPVVHAPGVAPIPVTEHTIGLMIALTKHIVEADAHLRGGGDWKPKEWNVAAGAGSRRSFKGKDLQGKTLGIIGLGNIGSEVARKCQCAFSMRVVAYDPGVTKERATQLGVELVSDIDVLLGTADVVSIHCPLTDETRRLIGAHQLKQMKPTAYLINTARGAIVDEEALVLCLQEQRIAGAGLDTFDPEPPRKDNPLFAMANVVVTPHIAGSSEQASRMLAISVATDVLAVMNGRRPSHMINPEVWPAFEKRHG